MKTINRREIIDKVNNLIYLEDIIFGPGRFLIKPNRALDVADTVYDYSEACDYFDAEIRKRLDSGLK